MELEEVRDWLIEQDDEDIAYIYLQLKQEIRARKEEDGMQVIW